MSKVRSFDPIERYQNYYITLDLQPNTAIVYEGVQMVKDGMSIRVDTVAIEDVRKKLHLDNLKR